MAEGGRTVGGAGGIGGVGEGAQSPRPAEPVGVGGGKKAMVVGGTAAAAGAGSQVAFLAMVLAWLKGLWAMMAALLANIMQMIFAMVIMVISKVIGFFGAIGAGISAAVNTAAGFFGMASQAAGAAATSIANVAIGAVTTVAVAASVVTGIGAMQRGDELTRADVLVADCTEQLQVALASSGEPTPSTDSMMANAEIIYSVFSAWGMPDENIAGILGNWEQESGMDPTRVQNTVNTPHAVSAEEQAGAENTDNGIGLGQWTYGRNTNLRTYADGHSASWGALEIQLGFMLSPAEGANADVVRDMIANSKGTPQAAAVFFHDEWERSADTSTATREANAVTWMGLLAGWEADADLANSILDQAGTTLDNAGSAAAAMARADCVEAAVVIDPSEYPIGVAPGPWGGYANGYIPVSLLSPIPWSPSYFLRSDAVTALSALNEAFRAEFGYNLGIADAYRDYDGQVAAREYWCSLGNCGNAAIPGTSNHGWALAADFGTGVNSFYSDQYAWMKANAPSYGWIHPAWAEPGGAHPEPWHWDFWGWDGTI